jgi:hypothetical protein
MSEHAIPSSKQHHHGEDPLHSCAYGCDLSGVGSSDEGSFELDLNFPVDIDEFGYFAYKGNGHAGRVSCHKGQSFSTSVTLSAYNVLEHCTRCGEQRYGVIVIDSSISRIDHTTLTLKKRGMDPRRTQTNGPKQQWSAGNNRRVSLNHVMYMFEHTNEESFQ